MVAMDKLIQQLEGSHHQIEKLVSQADHSLEIYPGWTTREVLAHFTGWDTAVIASLKLHAAGRVQQWLLKAIPMVIMLPPYQNVKL